MARCWRSTWFATAAEAYNAVDETRSRQRRLDLDQSQSGCGECRRLPAFKAFPHHVTTPPSNHDASDRYLSKVTTDRRGSMGKYPPAKPGALMIEPLKAAWRGQ